MIKLDNNIKKLQNKINYELNKLPIKEVKKTYWGTETNPLLEFGNIKHRIDQTDKYISKKLGNERVSLKTKQRKKFECPYCKNSIANIIEIISNKEETKHILKMNCTNVFCDEEYLLYIEE